VEKEKAWGQKFPLIKRQSELLEIIFSLTANFNSNILPVNLRHLKLKSGRSEFFYIFGKSEVCFKKRKKYLNGKSSGKYKGRIQ